MLGGVDACLQGWLLDKVKQAGRQRQRSQRSHHQQAHLLLRWARPPMKPDLPQHAGGSHWKEDRDSSEGKAAHRANVQVIAGVQQPAVSFRIQRPLADDLLKWVPDMPCLLCYCNEFEETHVMHFAEILMSCRVLLCLTSAARLLKQCLASHIPL